MTTQTAASVAGVDTGTGTLIATASSAQNAIARTNSTTAAVAANNKATVQIAYATGEDAAAAEIALDGDTVAVTEEGATVDGSKVTITRAGTYRLSGIRADGRVIVDTQDKETVVLILNGYLLAAGSAGSFTISSIMTMGGGGRMR